MFGLDSHFRSRLLTLPQDAAHAHTAVSDAEHAGRAGGSVLVGSFVPDLQWLWAEFVALLTLNQGTIGDVAAFSFFPTKAHFVLAAELGRYLSSSAKVMTAGEAGMVTTKNEALFKRMQSIKEFGKDLRSLVEQVIRQPY